MMSFVFGMLGLIFGSFLNVLILRHGEKPVTGRSVCMSCGAMIHWYDLVPVFSWLALRGKCRGCGKRISMQYPLVEIATAVTFAIIGGANIPLPLIIIALPVACLLIAIFVYDLYYMLIPDAWAYGCAGVALLSALVGWWVYGIGQLLYILIAGPLAALPLFVLWAVSRGRWMGLGDPKLALSFGWLLGISSGLYAVFAAFVIGAVVSVALMLITSEKGKRLIARVTHRRLSSLREGGFTMRSEVPFGPFLIASCFLTWFANLYGIPLPFFPW